MPTGYLDSYNQAGVDYYVNFVKVSYYTLQFFLIHINLHLVGLKRSRHWAFSYSIPLGLASTSKRSRRMAERLYCWTFWRIRQDCLPEFGTLRPEMGYCERTQDYLLSGIRKWSMSIHQWSMIDFIASFLGQCSWFDPNWRWNLSMCQSTNLGSCYSLPYLPRRICCWTKWFVVVPIIYDKL